jgi:hypothetical protein
MQTTTMLQAQQKPTFFISTNSCDMSANQKAS